ncbi:MAG: hypothetical protein DRP62_02215 [Planctomycetota bacterium]|nr:MAG: hypothetical protein DRP62_02215 [Planctomycetota bacterium]
MDKKDPSSQFNRQELTDFLHEFFDKLQAILERLFEQGRALVQGFQQQRTAEGPKHRHKRIMNKKVTAVLSHWHKLFEGMQASPQRIYSQIEQAIERREIPDVKISRISYPEAGALSAKRDYLRVQRLEYIFDICAAPFGTGFFFSWWLGETRKFSWLLAIIIVALIEVFGLIIRLSWWLPLGIGVVIVVLWRLSLRPTYYRLDTALMFQDSVHAAVLEVIDEATEDKGIRALSELEKKPIMGDLFKRKLI